MPFLLKFSTLPRIVGCDLGPEKDLRDHLAKFPDFIKESVSPTEGKGLACASERAWPRLSTPSKGSSSHVFIKQIFIRERLIYVGRNTTFFSLTLILI